MDDGLMEICLMRVDSTTREMRVNLMYDEMMVLIEGLRYEM